MRQDRQTVRQPDDRLGRQVAVSTGIPQRRECFRDQVLRLHNSIEDCVDILGLSVSLKQLSSFCLVRIPKTNLHSNMIYCFDNSQIILFLNTIISEDLKVLQRNIASTENFMWENV